MGEQPPGLQTPKILRLLSETVDAIIRAKRRFGLGIRSAWNFFHQRIMSHRVAKWIASKIGWGFIVTGIALAQWDEYAVAWSFFEAGSVILFFRAYHWKGIDQWHKLTSWMKTGFIIGTVVMFIVAYPVTVARKGDKPWSATVAHWDILPFHPVVKAFIAPPPLDGLRKASPPPKPPRPVTMPSAAKPNPSVTLPTNPPQPVAAPTSPTEVSKANCKTNPPCYCQINPSDIMEGKWEEAGVGPYNFTKKITFSMPQGTDAVHIKFEGAGAYIKYFESPGEAKPEVTPKNPTYGESNALTSNHWDVTFRNSPPEKVRLLASSDVEFSLRSGCIYPVYAKPP
jgi:hypothetical protein